MKHLILHRKEIFGVLDKTFNVFLFTEEDSKEGMDITIEDELQYFQDQGVEMIGHNHEITLSDIQTLFSMSLTEDQIETIRSSYYIVITSIYKI